MNTDLNILHANVLDHLYTNHSVKCAFPLGRHVSVVNKVNLYSVPSVLARGLADTCLLNTVLDICHLLNRQRDGVYSGVGKVCSDVAGKRSPAGTDF